MTLGRTIKTLRMINGYSQKDFAAKVGITQCGMSLIETGKITPKIETLCKICVILQVSSDYILHEEMDKYRKELQHEG